MDVSNSTGDSTGYRVLGSGGVPPSNWKPKEGQDVVYTLGGRKYVEINGLLHELLAKGTLKSCTYVRLEMPDAHPVFSVQFSPRGKKFGFDVSKLRRSGHEKLLVTLIPNGNGDPKPVLCRRAA